MLLAMFAKLAVTKLPKLALLPKTLPVACNIVADKLPVAASNTRFALLPKT